MFVITHCLDTFVPASPARVTFPVVFRRVAHEADGIFLVMYVGTVHTFNWFHRHVRVSRRYSDAEIVWNVRVYQSFAHKTTLTGSEPVVRFWRSTADLEDLQQHLR